MLYDKTDIHRYRSEFNNRFSNFAHKVPFLISFILDEKEVKVIDESTNMVYSFTWELTIPVKKFIYHIKETLVENGCYPVIIKTTQYERAATPEEVAEEMADGTPLEETTVCYLIEEQKKYLIDKVVLPKDFFIIKDLESGELFKYRLEKKSIFFLGKLRTNKLSSEEAGDFFFKEAEFVQKLNSNKEEQ